MHMKIPQFFQFIDSFDANLIKNKIKNLGIIYRNYEKSINIEEITKFKKFCKKKRIKFYISNNINLALKLKIDGVYIPAFNKTSIINKEKLIKNFVILGSAHNKIEINKKIKQGCEIIFLAPLFQTNKSKKFLDICKFNLLTLNKKIRFVALGGINFNNIQKIKLLNVVSVSGIKIFQKKTGPFTGRFFKFSN
ncbi:MAG: thiamine phosphate synthase [Candidatus Pelagibacterales bacterium]|nr:MAG: thiamine phosphate synthase [Pelagibacteraceae bacterium TMED233]RZO63467.1 MAG: thiamine phosphate synthase [Pelagibacterales bacterium]